MNYLVNPLNYLNWRVYKINTIMLMFETVRFYSWWIGEKICKKYNAHFFIPTKKGIKNLNMAVLTFTNNLSPIETKEIDGEDLFLGPDFLQDSYTLLNSSIVSSPHYNFIKAINDNDDISTSDYYLRFINGTIDWRFPKKPIKQFDKFYKKNKIAKGQILNSTYTPVKVYRWNNRYYIYDGKHRAALCSLLNRKVKCDVYSSSIALDGVWNRMFDLIGNNNKYAKHLNFIRNHG